MDTHGLKYYSRILDLDDEQVTVNLYRRNYNINRFGDLSDWRNQAGANVDWVTGDAPSVSLTGNQSSDYLTFTGTTAYGIGNYYLDYDIATGSNGVASFNIGFYNNLGTLLHTSGDIALTLGRNTGRTTITLTASTLNYRLRVFRTAPTTTTTVQVNDLKFRVASHVNGVEEIVQYPVSPLNITYRSAEKNADEVIHGSEANFTFFTNNGDEYDDIFESDPRDWKMEVVSRPTSIVGVPIDLQTFTNLSTGTIWTNLGTQYIQASLTSNLGSPTQTRRAAYPLYLAQGETLNVQLHAGYTDSGFSTATVNYTVGLLDESQNSLIGSSDSVSITEPTTAVTTTLTVTATTASAHYIYVHALLDYPGTSTNSAVVKIFQLIPERQDFAESPVWVGWVQPDNLTRRFVNDQYFIQLNATDGLAELKDIDYPPLAISANTVTRQIDIIKTILSQTGLELPIYSQVNYLNNNTTNGDSIWNNTYASSNRFVKSLKNGRKQYSSCYDALTKILDAYNCRISQGNISWSIVQKNEIASQTAFYEANETTYDKNYRDRTLSVDDYRIIPNSDELSKVRPIRKINLTFFNKNIDSVLSNGDFDEDIDGWDNTPNVYDSNTFDVFTWNNGDNNGKLQLQNTSPFNGRFWVTSDPFVLDTHATGSTYSSGATLQFSMDFNMAAFSLANGSTNCARYVYVQLITGTSKSFANHTDYAAHVVSSINTADYYYVNKRVMTVTGSLPFYYTGNYYILIGMYFDRAWNSTTIYLDNITANQKYDSETTTDQFFTGENNAYVRTSTDEVERDLYFADTIQNNDVGGLKWNTTSTGQTTRWSNTDLSVLWQPLSYLYLYEKLKDRSKFKNFVRITLKAGREINFDSIIEMQGRKYRIVGYQNDLQMKSISLDMVEVLEDDITMNYTQKSLDSIDGETD